MLKMRSLLVIIAAGLVCFQNAYSYCPTVREAETFRTIAVFKVLSENEDSVIYRDRFEFSGRGGYITSNESHYYKVRGKLPNTPAGMHVGFGSLINFDIIGARSGAKISARVGELPSEEVRKAVFADRSVDVVMAMKYFWRVLFLISETPNEWLSLLSGYDISDSDNLSDIFIEYPWLNQEVSSDGHMRLAQKLSVALSRGIITEFERTFVQAVLSFDYQRCSVRPKSPSSLFPDSFRSSDFYRWVLDLYNPSGWGCIGALCSINVSTRTAKVNASRVQEVGFLGSQDRYNRVRRLFIEKQDFYAVTDINSTVFWQKVREFSERINAPFTDAYVSCILCESCDHCVEKKFSSFFSTGKKLVVRSHCSQWRPDITAREYEFRGQPLHSSSVSRQN